MRYRKRRAAKFTVPLLCDARTGGGPTLAPRHDAAECHLGSPGPHIPSADILGGGVLGTLVTAAARAMLVVWLLYALFPASQEEAATSALTGAAPAAGMPVTEDGSARRILAKHFLRNWLGRGPLEPLHPLTSPARQRPPWPNRQREL